MEILGGKAVLEVVSPGAVLHAGELVLKTESELSKIVNHGRSDAVHTVHIGEAVLAEVDVRNAEDLVPGAEILHITQEEDSLEGLAVLD